MGVLVEKPATLATSGLGLTFVAIDFETADHGPDSACAVGLVRVSGNESVKREYHLICPPRRSFFFTPVHGITWERVRQEPSFKVLWPGIRDFFLGADFIASHNVSFDRRVLESCCRAANIQTPDIPYVCTMKTRAASVGHPPE